MPHKVYLNCLSVKYKYVFYPIEIQLLFHQPPSCFVSFRVRCESGLHYGTHGKFQPKFSKADHCNTKHSTKSLESRPTSQIYLASFSVLLAASEASCQKNASCCTEIFGEIYINIQLRVRIYVRHFWSPCQRHHYVTVLGAIRIYCCKI